MRKYILNKEPQARLTSRPEELDIAALATVLVTSEASDHPIENAFDDRRGPGGSRWIAAEPGEQTLIVAFDTRQTLRQITVEIEEQEVSRTQELQVAVSEDGGQTYRELVRQEYNFSPPGTTFEREEWSLPAQLVTHVRLWIQPDKRGRPCRAALTALVLH
jgi:hypothetical protein